MCIRDRLYLCHGKLYRTSVTQLINPLHGSVVVSYTHLLGAALFGVYSLYTVSGLDKEKYSVPILSLLYAIFSSEVTVSLFALSAV